MSDLYLTEEDIECLKAYRGDTVWLLFLFSTVSQGRLSLRKLLPIGKIVTVSQGIDFLLSRLAIQQLQLNLKSLRLKWSRLPNTACLIAESSIPDISVLASLSLFFLSGSILAKRDNPPRL